MRCFIEPVDDSGQFATTVRSADTSLCGPRLAVRKQRRPTTGHHAMTTTQTLRDAAQTAESSVDAAAGATG